MYYSWINYQHPLKFIQSLWMFHYLIHTSLCNSKEFSFSATKYFFVDISLKCFLRQNRFCLCKQINSTLFWFISAIEIETKHDDLNWFYRTCDCNSIRRIWIWMIHGIYIRFKAYIVHKEMFYFIEWENILMNPNVEYCNCSSFLGRKGY